MPRIMKISAKSNDQNYTKIICNSPGSDMMYVQYENEGSIPGFGYGDYLRLEIDMETGRIINWDNIILDIEEELESLKV